MNKMMEYKGYHAVIDFDAEDEIFVGKVFGIEDSLNFHGNSVEELKKMFHQSIDNYLEICTKLGKEPNKEFKGTFNVRIPPKLHKEIALEAAKQKITLNQYVVKCIENYIDRDKDSEKVVIYMPYPAKQFEWNVDNEFMDFNKYGKVIDISSEENLVYGKF